jgi:hypothetical protein
MKLPRNLVTSRPFEAQARSGRHDRSAALRNEMLTSSQLFIHFIANIAQLHDNGTRDHSSLSLRTYPKGQPLNMFGSRASMAMVAGLHSSANRLSASSTTPLSALKLLSTRFPTQQASRSQLPKLDLTSVPYPPANSLNSRLDLLCKANSVLPRFVNNYSTVSKLVKSRSPLSQRSSQSDTNGSDLSSDLSSLPFSE